MSNSILQGRCDTPECYITGSRINLHRHHIYGGARRKASEKWGCWVYLRADYHNMSKKGVHFDHRLDISLKRECQVAFEALHGHEMFIKVFGKSYL